MTSNSDPAEPLARVVTPEAAQTKVRSTPGKDLELEVQLSGPGCPVRWYKDGERLASQGRVQLEQAGTKQILRVQGAQIGDSGEYLCDVPQDSRIFLVSVKGNSTPLSSFWPWHSQQTYTTLLFWAPPHLSKLLHPSSSNPYYPKEG